MSLIAYILFSLSSLTNQTWEITKSNSVINPDYPIIVIPFHLNIYWLSIEHEHSSGLRNVRGKSVVEFQEKISSLLRTRQKNSLLALLDLLVSGFDTELLHSPPQRGKPAWAQSQETRYIPVKTQKEPRSLQTLSSH